MLGREIQIVSADHQNKADLGSALVRQWFDADVSVAIDFGNSAVSLAAQTLAMQKDRIVIHVGSASSTLTGAACAANGVLWNYDTYALARGVSRTLMQRGLKSWFLVAPDYTFGKDLVGTASSLITRDGGQVLGSVFYPLGSTDYSSFILQAQASPAQVVGWGSAGEDLTHALLAAAEFGLARTGKHVAAFLVQVQDLRPAFASSAGLVVPQVFYWDQNDATRAFSARFATLYGGVVPSQVHGGVYGATLHYLKSVAAGGSTETRAVLAAMRATPVRDMMTENGRVRQDGRVMRDLFMFEVKTAAESKGEWDLLRPIGRLAAEDVIRPLSEGKCALAAG